MTGSHSDIEFRLRLAHGGLDVAVHLDHRHPVLERRRKDMHEPELALARLQRELDVVDEDGARAVEHTRSLPEHALHRRDELGSRVLEPHRSRSGTTSKPTARSSACPTWKSVFSANCGPISCNPTGSPPERPQGTLRPGRPAMHDGIVSRSDAYMASGSDVRPPKSTERGSEHSPTSAPSCASRSIASRTAARTPSSIASCSFSSRGTPTRRPLRSPSSGRTTSGTSTVVESHGSRPAMIEYRYAQSRTFFATGPTWSRLEANATMP